MQLKNDLQRWMAKIYLRYVSVLFVLIAGSKVKRIQRDSPSGKRLLILKPDSIGDYILFRNFLTLIRNSRKFRGHTITFCGNAAFRDFAVHFDNGLADEFIWIDKTRVYMDPGYYSGLATDICGKFTEVIHAVRSRELMFDYLAKIASADNRFAPEGDSVNILRFYKRFTDRWYTRLIPAGDLYTFEFETNRQFFSALLEAEIPFSKPFFEKEHLSWAGLPDLPPEFAAIFPGAQLAFRRWSPANFAAVCSYISVKHGLPVVIIGGKDDQAAARDILSYMSGQITDLTGRTGLNELPSLIVRARLLVTNDTMSVHLAAAAGTPVVVVSQMNHYGRFVPYPPEVFPGMECVIPDRFVKSDPRRLMKRFEHGSRVNISLVNVAQVTDAVDRLLAKTNTR